MSSLPPLECKYVTEECLREWKADGNPNFRVPNPVQSLRFLYELCWTMVRGELSFQKCKVTLDSAEFVDKFSTGALGSTAGLCNAVFMFDAEFMNANGEQSRSEGIGSSSAT